MFLNILILQNHIDRICSEVKLMPRNYQINNAAHRRRDHMSPKIMNNKTRIAQAISAATVANTKGRTAMLGLVLGGAMMAPAGVYAQQSSASAAPLEEVVVTGIRSSLKRAVDQKRNASGVVDAISATDIGAFPDTNLAESLQR
ncbi:MAG: hypothetical protein ACI9WC_003837, partial [Arenicella sp.]